MSECEHGKSTCDHCGAKLFRWPTDITDPGPAPFAVGDWVVYQKAVAPSRASRVAGLKLDGGVWWWQTVVSGWRLCADYRVVARDCDKQKPKPAPAKPGEWRTHPDCSGWWEVWDANEPTFPYSALCVAIGSDGVVTNNATGRRILRVDNIHPRWLKLPDAPPKA